MDYHIQRERLPLQPVPRLFSPRQRIGHYGGGNRSPIAFSGARRSWQGSTGDGGAIASILRKAAERQQDLAEKKIADDAADLIRTIQNEPREAKWADARQAIADSNLQLQALDALGIENPQALIGEEQYAQPIGPEPRKTLGQLWESDPRYQRFQEWKQQRPTHPGYDKQFFEKGNRNFDLYQGS